MSLVAALAVPVTAGAAQDAGLNIGLLMDFSGSAEVSRDRRRAFELAIAHVNDGAAVLGRPVAFAVGDTSADPATAVAEARRLVEVEGVHASVSPNRSADALPVAEHVIGRAGIPTGEEVEHRPAA